MTRLPRLRCLARRRRSVVRAWRKCGPMVNAWVNEERPHITLEVVSRPLGAKGFVLLHRRWVVERTNAWNGGSRRLSKDYERRLDSSESMVRVSALHLMLRRLAPGPEAQTFRYR